MTPPLHISFSCGKEAVLIQKPASTLRKHEVGCWIYRYTKARVASTIGTEIPMTPELFNDYVNKNIITVRPA